MPILLSEHVVISVLRWDILLRAVSPRRFCGPPLSHRKRFATLPVAISGTREGAASYDARVCRRHRRALLVCLGAASSVPSMNSAS